MLVQRCALEQHRLIVPISITRPLLEAETFRTIFTHHRYRALVDTGAQRSVLARSVIGEQKLMRTGHMEFASLHGPRTHSRYLAGIAFWVQRIDQLLPSYADCGAGTSLYAVEEPFEVVDMDDNTNFDMILGFDILKLFSFSYSAVGQQFEIRIQP